MKSSIKIISVIFFCCLWTGISAQNIKVFFPQFTGKEYFFILNEGLKKDTVQSGIVGETGFVTVELKIPAKYTHYTGMASWLIANGKGINFIVDNEDFSINCEDSVPNSHNTIYKGSKENDRFVRYEAELMALFQRLDSIFSPENMTEKGDGNNPPPSFLKGMKSIDKEYVVIQKKLAADTSYAAFFWRTLNYGRGLGNRIYYKPDDQNDYFADLMHYLANDIDASRLYYSGLWNNVITSTFNSTENKTVWGENMAKMLKNTKSQRVFERFSYDLITICEQFGWEEAESVIATYLESSGRLPDDPTHLVNRAILQNKIKIGDKAPTINGEIPTNALLFFYESGCTHCQQQLAEITKYYSQFQEKGIRVISISTDENKEVFEYHSKAFPWPDKLCDFQGFKGQNLKNYGVIGTPTIYLIDENGIILDRQPRVELIKALNLK